MTKLGILSTANEMPILGMELKIHTESIKNVQLPSNFLKYVFLTIVKISINYWIENVNL